MRVEHAGHAEVAHLTRGDAGTAQLDGNLCGGQVPRGDADAATRVRQAHRDPHGIPLGQVGAWAHPQGRAGWGVDDVRRAGEDAGPPMEREGLTVSPSGEPTSTMTPPSRGSTIASWSPSWSSTDPPGARVAVRSPVCVQPGAESSTTQSQPPAARAARGVAPGGIVASEPG